MRYKVKASASVMQPYRCSEQEKAILSKVKEPCPSQRRGDNLGSETKGESMVKGIYADGNSTTEIYTEVAYFLGSHVEESDSRTSGVVGVVMVNAMLDDDSTVAVAAVVDSGRSRGASTPIVLLTPRSRMQSNCQIWLFILYTNTLLLRPGPW